MKQAFWLVLLLVLAAASRAEERAYRLVGPDEPSALPIARQILTHLAAGEIDEAARLSNEPARRREVLQDYLRTVGETEFRRVYAEYLQPPNHLAAEFALGPRRLLVWQLDTAGKQLAGQYFIESEGRFLMDDRPGPERAALRQALAERRKQIRR